MEEFKTKPTSAHSEEKAAKIAATIDMYAGILGPPKSTPKAREAAAQKIKDFKDLNIIRDKFPSP